jgi:DNA-nicking Smr family endonuclease
MDGVSDNDDFDPEEPVEIELGDELDLHAFSPKDAKGLVEDFIEHCLEKGYAEARIIHGKGKGVLREIVHAVLDAHPAVVNYSLAADRGSWGATVFRLRPRDGGD